MSDVLQEYKYNKEKTTHSPIITNGSLIDYNSIVQTEGSKTQIAKVVVINMDLIMKSLRLNPIPASMDIALIVQKDFKQCKYLLVDFKFNVTSYKNITSHITNNSIRAKFNSTKTYIERNDEEISCINIAFFVFKDRNFQQIRNAWQRRNLNNPKHEAICQSDFERIFSN